MRRTIAVAVVVMVTLAGATPVSAETNEGIQVHGHWKIEILDPDGTLVRVTEFENALTVSGAGTLGRVAVGLRAVASLGIRIEDDSSGGPCDDGSGGLSPCAITEMGTDYSVWFEPDSTNLQITATDTVVLEGSVTADHAVDVSVVDTIGKLCLADVSPVDCRAIPSGPITLFRYTTATLPSPVPVDAGQIIQVTVTISFS
jgi:hypothetical protein